MVVEWIIRSKFGELTASVPGYEGKYHTDISASLWFQEEEWIFKAMIRGLGDYGWDILATKEDNSLIELMNWVEEELKFRSSRDS